MRDVIDTSKYADIGDSACTGAWIRIAIRFRAADRQRMGGIGGKGDRRALVTSILNEEKSSATRCQTFLIAT